MARTYAKIVTANGEIELSHRQLDELRMLLSVRESMDITPNASPPVMESTYDDIRDWINQEFDKSRDMDEPYLD